MISYRKFLFTFIAASAFFSFRSYGALSAPWQSADIGTVGAAGSSTVLNDVYTVTGAGADIWNTADAFQFASQTLSGDCIIIARVASLQNTNEWAKAGVMIRETLDANSRWALVAVTPSNGVTFQWRSETGGNCDYSATGGIVAPAWVKLVRSGNTFTAYRSADGATWAQIGSPTTLSMGNSVNVGLAVTSHNDPTLCTTTFDSVQILTAPVVSITSPTTGTVFDPANPVSITINATATIATGAVTKVQFFANGTLLGEAPTAPYSYTWTNVPIGTYSLKATAVADNGATADSAPVTVSVKSLPPPWLNADIGSVGNLGVGSFSGGTFTVIGSGADIWDSVDGFQYLYQPLNGDGEIIARVASEQNSDGWTKAGVMLRESLAANSRHALIAVTPSNGVTFQWRSATGGNCDYSATGGIGAPTWLRLVRAADIVTAYRSTDGNAWTQVGAPATVSMAQSILVGLAVTAHNNNALCTATFDNVTVGQATKWPAVSITAPANGATLTAIANVQLTANASVTDGTLEKVQFFAGSTLLGEATTQPYAISLPPLIAGSYSYTAKAITTDGFFRISTPVTFTVQHPASTGDGLSATYFNNLDFTSLTVSRVDPTVNFLWDTGSPSLLIDPDTYSARWVGRVQPYYGETYTFYTNSDDGVRLWVNHQLLIDNWTNHAPTENSATIQLVAGTTYDIKLEFYENTGGATMQLSWSSLSTPKEIVPQSQLFSTGSEMQFGNGDGLRGTYYNVTDLSTQPVVSRIDPTVNFLWDTGSPSLLITPDTFSARWVGRVQPYYSELYTFYTNSDDGVRLWVNHQLLIDNWTNHGPTENSATVQLEAGSTYDIKLEFYENTGGATMQLSWSSPSTAKGIVPQSQLYSTGSDLLIGTGNGLLGTYYNVTDFSTQPALTRVDSTVNFNWNGAQPDQAVNATGFSVRWTGQVQAQYTDNYVLSVVADDGVRVWFNGQLQVNEWIDEGATEYSFTANLVAGTKYDIVIEYYQNGGGTAAQLVWSSAMTGKTVIPQSQLYSMGNAPFTGSGNGLSASYFNSIDLSGVAALTRVDATVNFDWGTGSPDASINIDNFSARWTGLVEPQFTEAYTFYLTCDDGARLWVNNVLLVDTWTDQAPTEYSGTIDLVAGQKVPIKLEYYEHAGGAVAKLAWSSLSRPKIIVPQSQLYSSAPLLAAPSSLAASLAAGSIVHLTWTDNSNNETGFVIERKTASTGFYFPIVATPGENAISADDTIGQYTETYFYRIKAVNATDSSAWSNEVSVLLDRTPPTIGIISPADGSYTNAFPFISATYSDNSGLPVNVYLDGTQIAINDNGSSFNFSASGLSEGTHTITVSDQAGNFSYNGWTFYVDATPPTITILNPLDGSNTTASPNISAIYSDNNSGPLRVYLDGTQVGINDNGSSFYFNTSGLMGGIHIITVSDQAGNFSTTSWSFNVIVGGSGGSLVTPRASHTATLLPNGKVVIAGGFNNIGLSSSTELYDPVTNTWSVIGGLIAQRYYHTSTLLQSGKVLLAGGNGANLIDADSGAVLYNPASNTWSGAQSLNAPRAFHTATLLPNGKVLVAGGWGNAGLQNTAELYDPVTNTWSAIGGLIAPRYYHTATLLQSGKVLVAGCFNYITSQMNSVELFDPLSNTWSAAGSLNIGRISPTATLLQSGKVLVVGGSGESGILNSAELYDPISNTWSMVGNLHSARAGHTATLLPNGKVVIAGGNYNSLDSVELFDPTSNTWSDAGSLDWTRSYHTATLLQSGKVLLTGGYYSSGTLDNAELYGSVSNPPMVITCPPNQVVDATAAAGATVSYAPATATDIVPIVTLFSYSKSSGSTFPIGVTTVNVIGVDATDNTTTASFSVTVNNPPPNVPTNLAATISQGIAHLTWTDNSFNETGFVIERKPGLSGTYSQIATPGVNTTSANDTITPDVATFYRIKAVNASGSSAWSNEISLLLDQTPPVITNLEPLDGRTVFMNTPTITIYATDAGSGVDWTSIRVSIGANKIYSPSEGIMHASPTILAGGIALVPTTALAYGSHTLSVDLSDKAGNIVHSNTNFTTLLPVAAVTQSLGNVGVMAINNSGVVVGMDYVTLKPFAWSNGTMTPLGLLAGTLFGSANAINDLGVIVGYVSTPDMAVSTAVVWLPGNYDTPVKLSAPNGISSFATGINIDGHIVGYGYSNNQLTQYSFYWSDYLAQSPLELPFLAAPVHINKFGQFIGIQFDQSVQADVPFWLFNLDSTLNEIYSSGGIAIAAAINDYGTIVGSGLDFIAHRDASVWENGSDQIYLGTELNGSHANGINNNNPSQFVGKADGLGAYLWDNGVNKDLNTLLPAGSGWILNEALVINDGMWIAGNGTYNGIPQAFLMKIQPPKPAAPSGLAASILSGHAIHLTWVSNSTNESNFVVLRGESPDGPFNEIALLNAGVTSYNDNNLTSGNEFWYYVFATNDFGDSDYSNRANTGWITAPTNLTAVANSFNGAQVELTWNHDRVNCSAYYIERKSEDDSNFIRIATVGSNSDLQYVDTVASLTRQYTYRVQAQSSLDATVSDFSNEAAIGAPPQITLTPQDGAQAITSLLGKVQIAMAGVAVDPNKVTIQLDTDPSVSGTLPITLLPSNISTDAVSGTLVFTVKLPLVNSGAYVFIATAMNLDAKSATATSHFTYTRSGPPAPANLTATVVTAVPPAIVLTWQDSDAVSGYIVERKSLSNPFAPVTVSPLSAGTSTWVDHENLSIDTQYGYRVKAIFGELESDYTNTAFATIVQGTDFSNYAPLGWTSLRRPIISADTNATIDVNTLSIELSSVSNGIDTSIAGIIPALSNDHVTGTPSSDLQEGQYQVSIQAGAANATWTFGVDTTAPAISGIPLEWTTLEHRPIFSCTITDALSGLDTFSIEFWLDGVDNSQSGTIFSDGSAYYFQPRIDLATGSHTITIKAADLAGNSASVECLLKVVDTDTTPPVIVMAIPERGGYLTTNPNANPQHANSTLTLEYKDDLSAVDPASGLLFIDNVAVDVADAFYLSDTSFFYQLPAGFPEGIHSWRVELTDYVLPIPNGPTIFDSIFIVDSIPPTIATPLADIANNGIWTSRKCTATIDDAASGVSPDTVGISINGHPITPIVTVLTNGSVEVDFEFPSGDTNPRSVVIHAEDRAGNPTDITYTISLQFPPPTLSIDPVAGNQTLVNVTILDGGAGIQPANISIAIGNPAIVLNGLDYLIVDGGYVYAVKLPAIVGSYDVSASVTDDAGQTVTASSTFHVDIPAALPPTPIIDETIVGSQFVNVLGHLPSVPDNLADLAVIADAGIIAQASIDLTTGNWQVSFQRTPGVAQVNFHFELSCVDTDGFLSAPATGNATFSAPDATDLLSFPPPLANDPTLPAASGQPVVQPVNAVPMAPGSMLAVTWDFDPADITGAFGVAATNKNELHIIGKVRGPGGPYGIHLNGLTADNTTSNGTFRLTVSELDEKTYKNIFVTASDGQGRFGKSISRSLIVDRTAPNFALPGTATQFVFGYSFDRLYLSGILGGIGTDENQTTDSTPVTRIRLTYGDLPPGQLPLGIEGTAFDMSVDSRHSAGFPYTYIGKAQSELQHGDVFSDSTWPTATMQVFDGAGNSWSTTAPIANVNYGGNFFSDGEVLFAKRAYSIYCGDGGNFTTGGLNSGEIVGITAEDVHIGHGETGFIKYDSPGFYPYKVTYYTSDGALPDYTGTVQVIDQAFVVDENDNGSTSDENFDRQQQLGVIMPINKSQSASNLRLMTFDNSLADGNGYIHFVGITHSSNIRLYSKRSMKTEDLLPSQPLVGVNLRNGQHCSYFQWDLTVNDDYNSFTNLDGSIYIECLPTTDNVGGRWIQFYSDAGIHGKITIHSIGDNGEGFGGGKGDVALGGPGYIDAASGAMKCSWPLVHSGSRIIPDVSLYYNSSDDINEELYDVGPSDIGKHFRHSLEMRLVRGDHTIVIIDQDGRRVSYTVKTAPTTADGISDQPQQDAPNDFDEMAVEWVAAARKGDFSTIKMVKQMNRGFERLYYVLIRPGENRQYLFEAATGKLCEIRDAFNNVATLEYDDYGGTRGFLREVRDNQGFVVRFDFKRYDTLVTDVAGNFAIANSSINAGINVTDTAGNSAHISTFGVAGPLGIFSYHLDTENILRDFTDANSGRYLISHKNGLVKSVNRLADGRQMSLSHNFKGSKLSYSYYSKSDDTIHRSWSQVYDDRGIWTSITAGDGQTLTQNIAKDFTSMKMTNKYGGTSNTAFDSKLGLPTDHVDADGRIFKKHYSKKTNPNYCIDGADNKAYNYLEKIAVTDRKVDGKGNSLNYSHNQGRVSQIVDAGTGTNATVSTTDIVAWDSYQQPTMISGPRTGYMKTLEYDTLGNVKTATEFGEGVTAQTQYATDIWGRPTRVILPDGRMIYKSYDVAGHEIQSVGPVVVNDLLGRRTGSMTGGESDHWYDNAGHLLVSRDVDGRTSMRHYNQLGVLETVTDSSSGTTTFSDFDALLLPRQTQLASGVKIHHTYDVHGHEARRDYPDVPSYSAVNGAVLEGAPQPRFYLFNYNDPARTVETTDARGFKTTKSMYPSGKLRTLVGDLGLSVGYEYDNNGDMATLTVPGEGKRSTELDQHGLVVQEKIEGVALDTTYMRDPLGAVTDKGLPGEIHLKQTIDALGRPTLSSINDTPLRQQDYLATDADFQFVPTAAHDLESGAVTQTHFLDACSRVAGTSTMVQTPQDATFDPANGGAIPSIGTALDTSNAFTYLNSGSSLLATDANGHPITHVYDAAVRNTDVKDQSGIGAPVTYDGFGRIATSADDRGKITTNVYFDGGTGFLSAKLLPDGREIRYFYDVNGNAVFESHVYHPYDPLTRQVYTISYTYDALNRVKEATDPAGHKTTTTYYASGKKHTVTDPDGRVTTYTYDAGGRLVSTVAQGGLTTKTTYAANGKVEKITHSDGRVDAYTYDARGRAATVTKTGEGTLTNTYANGDLVAITDSNGRSTQMKYDSLHRLVKTTTAGGQVTKRGYDASGFLVRLTDPMGQEFAFTNASNGRHEAMLRINADRSTTLLGTFTYEGNTPTSDGAMSWTLDEAGRVSHVSGCNVDVTYEYQHPLGLMTRKMYGSTDLSYGYDAAGYLQSLSDNRQNGVTYSRTAGGRLDSMQYSSGIDVGYGYTAQNFVNALTYTRGNDVLASFTANVDALGRRRSLDIQPTDEHFVFGYDDQFRLQREERTLGNAGSTTTSYTHDAVGNRLTRSTAAGAETYAYDADYKLTGISGAGAPTTFGYDGNGNTLWKYKGVTGTVAISYKNLNSETRTFSINGQRVAFAPTGADADGYKTVTLTAKLGSAISLSVLPGDAYASAPITIDQISYTVGTSIETQVSEDATHTGSVTVVEDAQAHGGEALGGFGSTSSDTISWTANLPQSEEVDYNWDPLNRLTDATRYVNGDAKHTATMRYGPMGWQAQGQNVHNYQTNTDETRAFAFGYGGELLGEEMATGSREYVNAGLDHVMWTFETPGQAVGADATRFWLTDINGSVFGIANQVGTVLERQRFDAFGVREILGADGGVIGESVLNNRTGFQGCTDISELGIQSRRNRYYDPSIGRFINQDPLGMVDGPAWYNYCHGDPVNGMDPMGTDDGDTGFLAFISGAKKFVEAINPTVWAQKGFTSLANKVENQGMQWQSPTVTFLGGAWKSAINIAGAFNPTNVIGNGLGVLHGEVKDYSTMRDAGFNPATSATLAVGRRAPLVSAAIEGGELSTGQSMAPEDLANPTGRELTEDEYIEKSADVVGQMSALGAAGLSGAETPEVVTPKEVPGEIPNAAGTAMPETRAAKIPNAAGTAPGDVPAAKAPAEILTPGGNQIGRPGASNGIRRLDGGLDAAEKMFKELSAGGKDITPPGYPGKLVEPAGGGRIGLRPVSSSADKSPSLDINIPGMPVKKIHFEP